MKIRHAIAISALLLQQLSVPLAFSTQPRQEKLTATVIAPNEIGDKEAFTFGVLEGEVTSGNTLDGEVVNIQTLDGVVVEKKKTDKYGRIFLAGGLAAGAYLVTRSNGNKCSGQINVKPGPGTNAGGSGLKITDPPGNCNAPKGLALHGEGFNPDASALTTKIGKTQVPVLAATAGEIKTGALPPTVYGKNDVEVTNTKNGQKDVAKDITFYSLKAKLGRQKLTSGEQTSVQLEFKPEKMTATVNLRILSGPVSFPGAKKEVSLEVKNGKASIGLVADPGGLGSFRLTYDLEKIEGG